MFERFGFAPKQDMAFSAGGRWGESPSQFAQRLFPSAPHAVAEADAVGSEQLSADRYDAGYEAGLADGLARAATAARDDRRALNGLRVRLGALDEEQETRIVGAVSAVTSRLVQLLVGEIGVSPTELAERARQLLALRAEFASRPILQCNPADQAFLECHSDACIISADPAMPRGSLRLETREGWIEDSIEDRLAAVSAMLDCDDDG